MFRFTAAGILTLAAGSTAVAQAPPRAEKTSPRPVLAAPLPPQITGSELYAYSPWTKFCGRDKAKPAPQQICLTVMEVKRHAGPFAAGAALIEGGDKKVFRVTLPAEVRREAGARIAVDGDKPLSGQFVTCNPRGCLADFEARAEFVAKLRTGEVLHLRGTAGMGKAVSFRLPLAGFASANDGPPSTVQQ
jgi:invasion protein IalB